MSFFSSGEFDETEKTNLGYLRGLSQDLLLLPIHADRAWYSFFYFFWRWQKMKTQTYIMMAIILLLCFTAGCSSTRKFNTRTSLQTDDEKPLIGTIQEEPFLVEIRREASKRPPKQDNWYFLRDAASSSAAQHEWRKRFTIPVRSEKQIEPVGLIEWKF